MSPLLAFLLILKVKLYKEKGSIMMPKQCFLEQFGLHGSDSGISVKHISRDKDTPLSKSPSHSNGGVPAGRITQYKRSYPLHL